MWCTTRIYSSSFISLYINDLKDSLKISIVSHFTADTSITYAYKNHKTLGTNLNFDLKSLVMVKSYRLSLNVNKSKLLIFLSNIKRSNIFIKLDRTKLIH